MAWSVAVAVAIEHQFSIAVKFDVIHCTPDPFQYTAWKDPCSLLCSYHLPWLGGPSLPIWYWLSTYVHLVNYAKQLKQLFRPIIIINLHFLNLRRKNLGKGSLGRSITIAFRTLSLATSSFVSSDPKKHADKKAGKVTKQRLGNYMLQHPPNNSLPTGICTRYLTKTLN